MDMPGGMLILKRHGSDLPSVDRNRIKRRMREAVRSQVSLIHLPVDVVLHPRRSVIDLDFEALEREVGSVFRAIQRTVAKQVAVLPQTAD